MNAFERTNRLAAGRPRLSLNFLCLDLLYWRNIAGNTIAETDSAGSTSNSSYHEYVFFAGRRVARADWGSSAFTVYYYFVDHLGSTRVMTQANGTVCMQMDYLPYGQEQPASTNPNTCTTSYKFTGYERDSETWVNGSSLDYAFARYYNARLGRFMSGDPLMGNVSDPQSLNRYAYVRNNPINFTDPTGLQHGDPEPDYPTCSYSGFYPNCVDPPDPVYENPEGWSPDPEILCRFHIYCATVLAAQRPQVVAKPQQFSDCLGRFGDANARANLTYQGYGDAEAAARAAGIRTSEVLGLWSNENSLRSNFPGVGKAGEVGPIQITPGAVEDLSRWGILPAGWDRDPRANITAGALYYAGISSRYRVPGNQAAARYNGGGNYKNIADAQVYQRQFNSRQETYSRLVNCMRE